MNTYGWIMMTLSVTSVLCLVSFCLYKVLNLPDPDMEEIKGPLEIDTEDTTDAD